MKYTIGDVVMLRKDLRIGQTYGDRIFDATLSAISYKPFTIVDIWNGEYEAKISENGTSYYFNDVMIENFYYTEKIDFITLLNLLSSNELEEGLRFTIEGYINPLVHKNGRLDYEDDYVEEVFTFDEEILNKAVYILPPKVKKEDKKQVCLPERIDVTHLDKVCVSEVVEIGKKINQIIDFLSNCNFYAIKEDK